MPNPASRTVLLVILIIMGSGWGLSFTLTKIAVSTGYQYFGLMAWQFIITAAISWGICQVRRKPPPWTVKHVAIYLMICLTGSLVPNSISYSVAVHLPAGMMSILIVTVPLFAFPIAILLGVDGFSWRRILGLLCGLGCVIMIAWPELSLPEAGLAIWIVLALSTALLYATEGNIIGKWGPWGLDPIQMLTGASILGIPLAFVLAISTGQFIDPIKPWGAAEWALVGSSSIHVAAYSTYFWMVTRGRRVCLPGCLCGHGIWRDQRNDHPGRAVFAAHLGRICPDARWALSCATAIQHSVQVRGCARARHARRYPLGQNEQDLSNGFSRAERDARSHAVFGRRWRNVSVVPERDLSDRSRGHRRRRIFAGHGAFAL